MSKIVREKRTRVDYSQHVVNVTSLDGLLIHHFKRPNTGIESVKFINTNGILAVTGDFGNWIFCREFHPSAKSGVSDSYWCEKLRIASSQDPCEFDSKGTAEEIAERLAEDDCDEETKKYLEHLLNYVNEPEVFYLAEAHGDLMPSFMDHDSVPHCRKIKFWLEAIFDAFDEICTRLEQQQPVTELETV